MPTERTKKYFDKARRLRSWNALFKIWDHALVYEKKAKREGKVYWKEWRDLRNFVSERMKRYEA